VNEAFADARKEPRKERKTGDSLGVADRPIRKKFGDGPAGPASAKAGKAAKGAKAGKKRGAPKKRVDKDKGKRRTPRQ